MAGVTNQTLAAMLQGISKQGDERAKQGDERHRENRERLERIEDQTTKTNGRLAKAERTIEKHEWAIYVIGAIALAVLVALLGKYLH